MKKIILTSAIALSVFTLGHASLFTCHELANLNDKFSTQGTGIGKAARATIDGSILDDEPPKQAKPFSKALKTLTDLQKTHDTVKANMLHSINGNTNLEFIRSLSIQQVQKSVDLHNQGIFVDAQSIPTLLTDKEDISQFVPKPLWDVGRVLELNKKLITLAEECLQTPTNAAEDDSKFFATPLWDYDKF